MSNGEYGSNNWYSDQKNNFKYIICTDGAGGKARELGIMPNVIVGDMDSISQDDLLFMETNKVKTIYHPRDKDVTDTFLALLLARENNDVDVVIWGGTGGRLDHTLANLASTIAFVKEGMRLSFQDPGLTIYITKNYLNLEGRPGDIVSIFPMGGDAEGITLNGFKYSLTNEKIEQDFPLGISNKLMRNEGRIFVESGILSVFHYKD
jgi:thiamine pyrophosphokinase